MATLTEICYVARPGKGGPQHEQRFAVTKPDQEIHVMDLIYPHRYDIMVKARLAAFYMENRDLWHRSHKEFMIKARLETICGKSQDWLQTRWNWWTIPNWEPVDCMHNEAFEMDCVKTARIVDSLENGEWHSDSRIAVIRAQRIKPAVNGVRYDERLYLGDGQHRLSALVSLGFDTLQPHQYEFLEYREYSPWVTSDMYITAGIITESWRAP